MAKLLEPLLAAPEVQTLLTTDHFSVDCFLLQVWASHSSMECFDGVEKGPLQLSGGVEIHRSNTGIKKCAKGDFHGPLLSKLTHSSTGSCQER